MDFRPQTMIAYTNPIYEFARFIEAEGLPVPSLHSIVVGAEKLHAFQRQKIEEVFGVRVFETYGSREFMLIGAECEEHAGLHLSMDNLLVEVVDDEGSPTPTGEIGNVVVTDLFNYAMPFIRYVTGDLATRDGGSALVAGIAVAPCCPRTTLGYASDDRRAENSRRVLSAPDEGFRIGCRFSGGANRTR